jgi:hypothetical protein
MGMPLLQLERLTFRFVEAGFVVLTATLVLGVFTTVHWRWDHKTVFSLLAWAVFAALLAGRQPARLARPPRHALALRRRGAAAAGLRGFALRARSAAGRGARRDDLTTMKYLLLLLVVGVVGLACSGAAAAGRRRQPPPAHKPAKPAGTGDRKPCWPVRTAACTCRRPTPCSTRPAALLRRRAPPAGPALTAPRGRPWPAPRIRTPPPATAVAVTAGRRPPQERPPRDPTSDELVRRRWASTAITGDGPRVLLRPGLAGCRRGAADSRLLLRARRAAWRTAQDSALARVYRTYAAARAAVGLVLVAVQGLGSLLGARSWCWLALVCGATRCRPSRSGCCRALVAAAPQPGRAAPACSGWPPSASTCWPSPAAHAGAGLAASTSPPAGAAGADGRAC